MTFLDRYQKESTWQGKVTVMGLYHTIMITRTAKWTLSDTAKTFDVSIGLVSENLKLNRALDNNPRIHECKTREEALKGLTNGTYLETHRQRNT